MSSISCKNGLTMKLVASNFFPLIHKKWLISTKRKHSGQKSSPVSHPLNMTLAKHQIVLL